MGIADIAEGSGRMLYTQFSIFITLTQKPQQETRHHTQDSIVYRHPIGCEHVHTLSALGSLKQFISTAERMCVTLHVSYHVCYLPHRGALSKTLATVTSSFPFPS